MNWLAHAFLAEADTDSRLGNLLADCVKGKQRHGMPEAFLRGVRHHQAIDAFTDSHPVVHRSRARIGGDYRIVTGILVDIFYDHFLALDWHRFSAMPLEEFTAGLYADLRATALDLPAEARFLAVRIAGDDLFGSYRTIDGIEAALRRVSARLLARVGREFALERAVAELRGNFDALRDDFAEFFPLLRGRVAALSESIRPTAG